MKIDFNNLRLRIGNSYNRLWIIYKNKEDQGRENFLHNELLYLRNLVGALLSCESGKGESFNAIDYNLLPNEDDEE